jgi:hypothetical protein
MTLCIRTSETASGGVHGYVVGVAAGIKHTDYPAWKKSNEEFFLLQGKGVTSSHFVLKGDSGTVVITIIA